MATASSSTHPWRFFRAGGLDQARIDSPQDFLHLKELDQKLWVALSCPVNGLEFDERTLALIDSDKDNRVRAPEVIEAVQWVAARIKDLGALKNGSDAIPLALINDTTKEGKELLDAAREILRSLGKTSSADISLADVADTNRIFAQTKFNGDGVVPPDSAPDDTVKSAIQDIITCLGGEPDRCGKPGVTQGKVDAFFGQLSAFSDWAKAAETGAATVLPLGDATAGALEAVKALRTKAEDYFARCRLAAFDARAAAAVNRKEEDYLAIAAKDLRVDAQEIRGFPLARVEPGRPLPLTENLNPAWIAAVAQFRHAAVAPVHGAGKSSLTEEEWHALNAKLAPYEAWLAAKPAGSVEPLGLPKIRALLGSAAKATITQLIAQDQALEPAANAIAQLERLMRYVRDLHRLLNNFVNFSDFYSKDRLAVFQAGTLYLDSRACELCVRVDDPGKHVALAGLAKVCLAYCDCTRPAGERMTIAAAFTDGDGDNLMVGRNGIFYDRKGRDWDATITRIVENPISIRQAFWSPYKKLVRLIEEQVAKRAAAAEAASDARLATAAATAANADKTKPAEPKKIDVGTVAALGVTFGALGTALVAIAGYLAGVFRLPFWQLCLAFAGLMMLISGPAMLIAWLKLRQRNLGPILDANGWAINGRVKMNVQFGRSLTAVAALPAAAQTASDDPFGERPPAWPKLLAVVLAVAFVYSLLNHFGLVYRLSSGKLGKEPATAKAQAF
jgi:hypothetical protein